MDEKTPILAGDGPTGSQDQSNQPLYYGDGQTPTQRYSLIVTSLLVGVSVAICFGLCIYRGVIRQLSHIAFIYFMCAASVFGVALIHFIMVAFIKKGFISAEKNWFTYFSALLVILQSIFIDVLVFYK